VLGAYWMSCIQIGLEDDLARVVATFTPTLKRLLVCHADAAAL